MCFKCDYFLTFNNIGQYLSNYIQTWHDGRLMHGIYAHACLDDLGLDLPCENVCKNCPSCWLFIMAGCRCCVSVLFSSLCLHDDFDIFHHCSHLLLILNICIVQC